MKVPRICDAFGEISPVQITGGEQTLFAVTADGKVISICPSVCLSVCFYVCVCVFVCALYRILCMYRQNGKLLHKYITYYSLISAKVMCYSYILSLK